MLESLIAKKQKELEESKLQREIPLTDNDSIASVVSLTSPQCRDAYQELKRTCRKRTVSRHDLFKLGPVLRKLVNLEGVELDKVDSFTIGERPHQEVSLPAFLMDAINGSTSFNLLDICLDCRLCLADEVEDLFNALRIYEYGRWKRLMLEEEIGKVVQTNCNEFLQAFNTLTSFLLEELKEKISIIKTKYDSKEEGSEMIGLISDRDCRLLSLYLLSYSELTKRQLLFGVPFTYNMLMEGYHSLHREKEVLGTVTEEQLKEIRLSFEMVASYLMQCGIRPLDIGEVRLPIGTSQGLLLKSESDSIFFRGFSKFCLSLLASKCSSREELHNSLKEVGQPFVHRGFYNPYRDAFLGLRRMHMKPKKGEPFFHRQNDVSADQVYKLQGRIRAIFPFCEGIKFWYKRLCDPVKKKLFSERGMFSVDPAVIAKSQLEIERGLLSSPELKRRLLDKEEWVTSYDLSAYDMSCPYYLNQLYNELMIKVIPNGASLWADGHDTAGVIHFQSVNHFIDDRRADRCTLYRDDVEGRSTLSGQSDVTLKNNIIHGCLLMSFLIHHFGLLGKRDVIRKIVKDLIEKGSTTISGSRVICHMHGDDVMFYFSSKSSDYDELARYLTATGIKTGFESGGVYLKRVCDPDDPSRLINLFGSLEKNRLGEYNQKNCVTGLLSVLDNIELCVLRGMSDTASELLLERQRKEWKCFTTIMSYLFPNKTIEEVDIISVLEWNPRRDLEQISSVRLTLSKALSKMVERITPKTIRIRQSLLAEAYKTGSRQEAVLGILKRDMSSELEDDNNLLSKNRDELSDLSDDLLLSYSLSDPSLIGFSQLQNSLLAEMQKLTRDQLKRCLVRIQEILLDNDGRSPSVDQIKEIVSRSENSSA